MSHVIAETSTGATAGARAGYAPYGTLRLALASLVLIQHVAAAVAPAGMRDLIAPMELGSTAVYAFFVLSGVIIADAIDLVYRHRPGAFLVNRVLRIVPSYLVALLVFVGGAAIAFALGVAEIPAENRSLVPHDLLSADVWLANILAVVPFVYRLVSVDPQPIMILVIWAVRVEMLFYGVMAAAVLVGRLGLGYDRVLTVIGAGLVAATVFAFEETANSFLSAAPFFVLGVAMQRALARPRAALVPVIFAAVAFILSVCRIAALPEIIEGTSYVRETWTAVGLFAGCTGLILVLSVARIAPRSRFAAVDREIGELTFPLYLNHMIVVLLAAAIWPEATLGHAALAFALSVMVSILVAAPTEPLIARLRDLVRGRPVAAIL